MKKELLRDEMDGIDSSKKKMTVCELYEKQNNQPMTEEQRAFAAGLIGTIWEDGQ